MLACPAEVVARTSRPIPYERRRLASSTLHRVVRENLPALLAGARDQDTHALQVPSFVIKELEGYVACGLLSRGFLRAVCGSCKQSVLVAFSCKGRGFCPSCCRRRMEDTTQHIIQAVLPDVPIRQWVLSLPYQIRPVVAFQPGLFAAVVRIFMSEVSRSLIAKAKQAGLGPSLVGAIAFLQRFGSTVNLNPHVHAVFLDGVYRRLERRDPAAEPELEFHPVAPPTPEEINTVSARVCRRVIGLLERRGFADAAGLIPQEDLAPEQALTQEAARVFPIFAFVNEGHVYPVQQPSSPGRAGEVRGFSTHAAVRAAAADKEGRRRIVRYCVRPPFADQQLSATRDGRVAFELRRPRSNGTTHVVFSELGFLKRLSAIIPPPKQHRARYFGVLSSASPFRRFVVPAPRVNLPVPPILTAPAGDLATPDHRPRAPWAALLRRVYDVDALRCPTCPNGQLRVIAAITEPRSIKKILSHLGLDDEPPPPRRVQEDLRFTEP